MPRRLFPHPSRPLAGPRSARSAPAGRMVRLASPAVALLVAWMPLSASGNKATRPVEPDAGLSQAVLSIRQGFITHRPEPILPLIPEGSKVYLSVETIASDKGFYSRDQMSALLRKTFSRHTTLDFKVRIDRIRGDGDKDEVIVCPAVWHFEKSGVRKQIKLRFVISRGLSSWILKEVREIS